jgi:hypothetical protein
MSVWDNTEMVLRVQNGVVLIGLMWMVFVNTVMNLLVS